MSFPLNDSSVVDQLAIAARVGLAAVFGGILGWERWMAGKFAGIRTHLVVAAASGLACALTSLVVADQSEAARVLAAVFTGVGFIGAGAILQTRNNALGITTSATVLLAATVGAAAGLGAPVLAAVVSVGSIVALRAFGFMYFHLDPVVVDPDLELDSDSKQGE